MRLPNADNLLEPPASSHEQEPPIFHKLGGAHIYEAFIPLIDSWIVTEIPETVENADVFMPANYLESFQLTEAEELEGGLVVRRYERMS